MRTKTGYSLIELIIAIIIIPICVGGVTIVFQNVLVRGFRVRAMTTSVALAEEKMDETLRLGYSSVADVSSTAFNAPFGDYTYTVVVRDVESNDLDTPVINAPATGYKNVKVNVTHSEIGTITLTSLLTDY